MAEFGRVIGIVAMLALSALAAFPAGAQVLTALPAVSEGAVRTGDARPIPAWTEFCRRYPGECALDPTEPAVITLTPRAWALVADVNRRVNRSVRPVTDAEHWGVTDRWDLAEDGAGDCEDFQLLKRKLLAGAGLPRRAMRMTVVIDEKNEGHAVLTLVTDRGDLVLDNKRDAILPWSETGYVFVKRESRDALAWDALGSAPSPVATANR